MRSIDAANLIIQVAQENNLKITNLKLQKLLYYANAYSLKTFDTPLIDGTFERWSYGPVERTVYDTFKSNGSDVITGPAPKFNPESFEITKWKEPDNISDDEKNSIQLIVEHLGRINAFDLVDKTHEELLWSKYEHQIAHQMAPNYKNDEIKDYFKNNDIPFLKEP